ncbi:SDR family NAD(P)-dependent oxidoreductase [Nocardia vinacea]|uniref:SDR family NAD(P)-dependent oxidoreductase n=1 Tax=Nocardia vinacea TaxID=96468 RepID=UPI00031A64C3|nr:SDR family NAD(P)-dependent oxidoreductase [Nocardia vinacea]
MQSILISGGNSGIGLHAARMFLALGYHVVLLGRDQRKGEEAIASFGSAAERASFYSVDLSTHDGVREAAARVLADSDRFDVVLHTTGVLTSQEMRTADGLHPFFTVNYLSRYHLTQLLLPALRHAEHPHVVMMTARVSPSTSVDLEMFPTFEPFSFSRARKSIHVSNHHYAAHLARTEPGIRAGVVNAGAAKTDILRMSPWYMRASAKVVGPLLFNSVEESAHNAVQASRVDYEPAAVYWDKPGDFERRTPIVVDEAVTRQIIDISRKLTGV